MSSIVINRTNPKKQYTLSDFNLGDLVEGGDGVWKFLAIVVFGTRGKTLLTLESNDHENGSSPFSVWLIDPNEFNLRPAEAGTSVTILQQKP